MSWMTPCPDGPSASASRLPSGVVKISAMWCRRCSIRTSPSPRSATASRTRSYVVVVAAGRPRAACPTGSRRRARPAAQGGGELVGALGDLDRDQLAGCGEVGGGGRAQQPAAVDDDDVVAGALQLAEQVRGDQDRDAEVGVDAADQAEHLVAADRVEAVGRLVEQDQLRVVDQGLGELDPLLHAGRVAADGAVALLVEADVAQRVGGALAGRGRRQPGHAAPCGRRTRWPTRRAAGSRARACSPTRSRMAAPSVATSRPSTAARPAVAGSRPSRILISVDLPAPLAPTSPTTPGSMSTVSSETAVTVPYLLVRSSVLISVTGPTLRKIGAGVPQGTAEAMVASSRRCRDRRRCRRRPGPELIGSSACGAPK